MALRRKFKLLNMAYRELSHLALFSSPASSLTTSHLPLHSSHILFSLNLQSLSILFLLPETLFFLLCQLTPCVSKPSLTHRLGEIPLIYGPLSTCIWFTKPFSLCSTITWFTTLSSPLLCKLPETRDSTHLFHYFMPSAQESTWN